MKEPVRYYFSGIGNFNETQKVELSRLCTHRLQSCHKEYIRQTEDWCHYAAMHGRSVEILLDSGAFTAWNKGKVIELKPLIQIYKKLIDKYESGLKAIWLINLDKIPGERGRTATPEEIEDAIRVSDENFKILVDNFGHRVLPVFHQNESRERLLQICDMSDYICVSPRNDVAETFRVRWAAEVHTILRHHHKQVKTHGLATTGMRMLSGSNWYSADSAWWLQTALNGSIMYLHDDGSIRTVQISERAGARKDLEQHYFTLHPIMKEVIDRRLAVHGLTADEAAKHHTPRQIMCIKEILEWLKVSDPNPLHVTGLFDL